MVNSAIQSPSLSTGSPAESSTRRLRARAPKSYTLPGLLVDDDELRPPTSERNGFRVDKKSNQSTSNPISAGQLDDHSNTTNYLTNKSGSRLAISRQHRVSTPPPLPTSSSLDYLSADNFPAWLLGDAIVKSSSNYLSQLSQSPTRSSSRPLIPTSPIRASGSSILGTSPSKINKVHRSLSRHSSCTNLGYIRQSIGRSLSPDEELESRREKFWEHYEYDPTVPHLQPKYFDKPLPTDEQWSDLDIQNVGIISEPRQGSPTIHLFEVFGPSSVDSTSGLNSEINSLQKDNLTSSKNSSPGPQIDSIPFGFNFLPADYNGHQGKK